MADKPASTVIPISQVVPDENQPRKYFNAEKLKTLKNSIQRYGIINPLVVQEVSKGKYLLVDGERRFRAATELKLKEVPVLIEKPQTDTERLVRQFNIQEQHEAWTPVEKAVAIENLSGKLGISLAQTCKLLNVTEGDSRRYAAFAELADKTGFVRNEVPLDYAPALRGLKRVVERIYAEQFEEEFTRADEKRLEQKVVSLIKSGVIQKKNETTRLKDAFVKDPKSIQKFLTDAKATPMSLFLSTKAKGAYHLRNVVQNSRYATDHAHRFLELRDVKISQEQAAVFKNAAKVLQEVASLAN